MASSPSSAFLAMLLVFFVAAGSAFAVEESRRQLKQSFSGRRDCEFEGVWTNHGEFYESRAGKRCKCVDSKWRDCRDIFKEPEIKVVYVREEPKKKFKDCEKYGEWIKHGDLHIFDGKECRCWDSIFDSCKAIKKPEVKVVYVREEPKKFKDCEREGVWTKHGSQYTSKITYQKCRCWDGIWDSCVYEFPW